MWGVFIWLWRYSLNISYIGSCVEILYFVYCCLGMYCGCCYEIMGVLIVIIDFFVVLKKFVVLDSDDLLYLKE